MLIKSDLMIIREFDLKGISVHEPEADAPLIIYGDRKLPVSLPLKFVQPVAWRYLQIIKPSRQIHLLELPYRPSRDFRRKTLQLSLHPQVPSVSVGEGFDHNKKCNLSRDKCQ
jgi:hypothetical protein